MDRATGCVRPPGRCSSGRAVPEWYPLDEHGAVVLRRADRRAAEDGQPFDFPPPMFHGRPRGPEQAWAWPGGLRRRSRGTVMDTGANVVGLTPQIAGHPADEDRRSCSRGVFRWDLRQQAPDIIPDLAVLDDSALAARLTDVLPGTKRGDLRMGLLGKKKKKPRPARRCRKSKGQRRDADGTGSRSSAGRRYSCTGRARRGRGPHRHCFGRAKADESGPAVSP